MKKENNEDQLIQTVKAYSDANPDVTVLCLLRCDEATYACINGSPFEIAMVLGEAIIRQPELYPILKKALEGVDYANEQVAKEESTKPV